MIRASMCFIALLFVVGCAIYLPQWVDRYRTHVTERAAP